MTTGEIALLRVIEVVRSDDGVVGSDLQHVFGGLWWSTVDGEGVVGAVDGAPVANVGLE